MTDMVGKLMNFEAGELDTEETIELFVDLLNSGLVNKLQGSYGRGARDLINAGWIVQNEQGEWIRSDKEIE